MSEGVGGREPNGAELSVSFFQVLALALGSGLCSDSAFQLWGLLTGSEIKP